MVGITRSKVILLLFWCHSIALNSRTEGPEQHPEWPKLSLESLVGVIGNLFISQNDRAIDAGAAALTFRLCMFVASTPRKEGKHVHETSWKRPTGNAKCPIFLGNFTPKTSN